MRALVLLLLASTAFAQPNKSKTKRAPDKFTKAAGDAFTAASAADAKGDLRTALGLYEKAHAISPHSATMYNIADVQRRLSMLQPAIKSYETYLAMSPDAKDRAEIEALVDQLMNTPGKLIITTTEAADKRSLDLAAGYVIVSGKIERKPGPLPKSGNIEITVPPGEYVVDFVTPLTYASEERCYVEAGGRGSCRLYAEPRIDGNVVVSAATRYIDVTPPGERNKHFVYKRSQLPAGKHRFKVQDRNFDCAPLTLDVPAGGNTILYTFLGTTEYEYKRCRTLDIKQQRLQFEQ